MTKISVYNLSIPKLIDILFLKMSILIIEIFTMPFDALVALESFKEFKYSSCESTNSYHAL